VMNLEYLAVFVVVILFSRDIIKVMVTLLRQRRWCR